MDINEEKRKDNLLHLARVHETAVVSPEAQLGKGVEVGPYSVIGDNVSIGDGTTIDSHVIIDGMTEIGKDNEISVGVVIGYSPQHLDFDGEGTRVTIGDGNNIREYATIHRGTKEGKGETRIGNNNYIMAYCHIAHDCYLGDNIIMANSVNLAGHVEVEDRAFLAGLVGIHQFCRIGRMAMVGGHSKVVKDVPPYILVDGHPASVKGVNVVGLRRNGFSPDLRSKIKEAYRILYRSKLRVSQAIEVMDQELDSSREIEDFLRFLRNAQRGICR